MEQVPVQVETKPLPQWTYWLPLLIITIGRVITVRYFYHDRFAVIYLPYLLALPMYFWWGLRVFPQHFMAETLTAALTIGVGDWVVVTFYGLANATKVLMGYLLYRQMGAKTPLKSTKGFGLFFFWVLFIQNIIGNFLFLAAYVQAGAYGSAMFWKLYAMNTVKDILWAVILVYPALIYFTPFLRRENWARRDFAILPEELSA